MATVTVVGGGSWGTTLASLLAGANDTVLWSRDADVADEVTRHHRNTGYLPDIALDPALQATTDLDHAVRRAEVVLLAVPSRYFRDVLDLAAPHIAPTASIISVTKGIEAGTGFRMSEVILDVTDHDPQRVCVLSGPNLAKEVMAGQPSATVLACPDQARGDWLRHVITTESFRVFTNTDVIGCEIGGAVKNVIAIAAGIGDGLGFGWNTKAALMTRGLAEMARLGMALTASPITFLGLAGNGDLTATCSSLQSRNRNVGEELGKGRSLDAIVDEMHMVAEGVTTTRAIADLAHTLGVPMPITRKVDSVLTGALAPIDAVHQLMEFEPGSEFDDL